MKTITMTKESAIEKLMNIAEANDQNIQLRRDWDITIWFASSEGEKADKANLFLTERTIKRTLSKRNVNEFIICSYKNQKWVQSYIIKVA